jgi:mannitol-specific phosphotransferase system IIBC component
MAKSNHLSGLLLLALVCIHFCIASNIINNKKQRAKIKDFHKAQSGSQEQRARSKDFSTRHLERVRNKDQRTKTSSRRTIRVSDQSGNSQLGTPTTGDVFGIYFPEKKRIAHVGFIDKGTGHG